MDQTQSSRTTETSDDFDGMVRDEKSWDDQWSRFQKLYGDSTENEKRRPSKASLFLVVGLVAVSAVGGVASFLHYF